MCDTLCKLANWSSDGQCYFAKNSDRSPNEPLLTLRIAAQRHEPGARLRCTYVEIDQVEQTREMILCKPSWTWGAEMGVNDARVAIGNEAVFTKAKRGAPALIGMDLLRLALERADTATGAVEVIVDLLERYGQGGNCGFDHEFYYDNSFLVCDPEKGYVLETSGKNYAVAKITDRYAISNRLCIGADHVMQAGVDAGEDFARHFSEPVQTHFSQSKKRRCEVTEGLRATGGAAGLTEVLRTHAPGAAGRELSHASVGSVCMHAGGLIGDHTTGSLIATLRKDKPITLWVTGASTPCISAFKPVFWGSDTPPVFDDPAQSLQYWMARERLHRAALAGKVDVSALRARIGELERQWFATEEQIMSAEIPDVTALAALSARASEEEQALIKELSDEDWQAPFGTSRFARYWQKKNARLGQETCVSKTLDW
ncbi:MAG: peptidase U34 [Coriobacteriia bacterium]|nr:peptidase U34 [Coriobacteriia bacterium]